jgi:hypothetical protein
MIPEIGIMVGAYIITRCVGLLGSANPVAQILAVLTVLVAGVVCFDLLGGGAAGVLEQMQEQEGGTRSR